MLSSYYSRPTAHLSSGALAALAAMSLAMFSCADRGQDATLTGGAETAFKIGVLFDESGPLGDFGKSGIPGVRLALRHVNAAGGVLGRPVELATADSATEVEASVQGARDLIERHRAHALVGPLGSQAALEVVRRVTATARIPTVSPTATSPQLTGLDDNGFFFRATASDGVQAPILADLATELGFERIAVFFQDDTYGRGLNAALAASFPGEVASIAIIAGEESYLPELQRAADAGAQALVAVTYVSAATVYIREALDHGLFDQFLFVDATASPELVAELGAEPLEGMKGTAPEGTVPGLGDTGTNIRSKAFAAAFAEIFGRPPETGLEASSYDITICLCLAAELAGSTDGAAIRDALPSVCGRQGEVFGPGDVTAALATIRTGRSVNYEGASNAMEWNVAGDIARGFVTVWQFSRGEIVQLEQKPFIAGELSDPSGADVRASIATDDGALISGNMTKRSSSRRDGTG